MLAAPDRECRKNRPRPETATGQADGAATGSEALRAITALLDGTEPVTWVFTGDSITQGSLYTEGWRSFSEHFTERVRWELRRFEDVVINTGVFGERSPGLLASLEARVLRFQPDVVLLLIGMNDALGGPAGRLAFHDNLYEIVGRIRESGAIPVLQTPNAIYEANAPLWADLPAYVEIVREVADESSSPLVDHWRHWRHVGSEPVQLLAWLHDQSIHPNGPGHREMAREIIRTLGIFDPGSLTCQPEAP